MNGSGKAVSDGILALQETLRALASERSRLEELREHYTIVNDSKFAQLRGLFGSLRSLTRRPKTSLGAASAVSAIDRAAPQSETSGAVPALPDTVVHADGPSNDPYAEWLRRNAPRGADYVRMRELIEVLPYQPLISIVTPVYNTPERYLRAAIESVSTQIYPHWELCLADDASPEPHVRSVLREYEARDQRIKCTFRSRNGHISAASNSALQLATGEFVGLLDHDDVLVPEALFEVAAMLNRHRDADMIYSDEDKIDDDGSLRDPFFKPDWCPESFMSRMYTCHFGVYRRSLVEELGGFRSEFDGSQDYDLVLRLMEKTSRIFHIPRVLYHWRIHPASAAGVSKPYASRAAERALNGALERRNEPGQAREIDEVPGTYIIRYEVKNREKISIIIPTRDHGEDVERCLSSIFARAGYENFEVLLVDNGSTDRKSLEVFEKWARRDRRVRILRYDVPFNFPKINNYAVTKSSGHYLLFLNNDTEVLSDDWLEAMVEQAQRPPIGAVGAFLLYADNTVQHAGVVIGIGGVAGHPYRYHPGHSLGYISTLKAINNYSAVTAACLMVRRDVFDLVAGFDESLGVAFNDVDFCLKIQAAGFRNVWLPHVVLHHFESKSRGYEDTPEKIVRFESEIAIMESRWHTRERPDPCYSPHLSLDDENVSIRL
jgi:O-antigen biosynthesis protein